MFPEHQCPHRTRERVIVHMLQSLTYMEARASTWWSRGGSLAQPDLTWKYHFSSLAHRFDLFLMACIPGVFVLWKLHHIPEVCKACLSLAEPGGTWRSPSDFRHFLKRFVQPRSTTWPPTPRFLVKLEHARRSVPGAILHGNTS